MMRRTALGGFSVSSQAGRQAMEALKVKTWKINDAVLARGIFPFCRVF